MPQGSLRVRALAALLSLGCFIQARAADWQPITPEELQMKSEPKAPAAAAIYLYRQVDRDDSESNETLYSRIKIFTDEGRKYANVEIPYYQGSDTIRGLEARVIHPDGRIVDFDGTVYEKPLVKARGLRMMSKSFTLPGVEVGSIIEYRYRRLMPYGWAFNSRWLLSDDLFTRRAEFTLRPADGLFLRWSWPLGLPPDTEVPQKIKGLIRLKTQNVPAFVTEDYMPPEDAMKFRVEFIYEGEENQQSEPEAYWRTYNRRAFSTSQRFSKPTRALQDEVARLVQAGDSVEAKARKLYARAQQIRNLSFEREVTEQESRRAKLDDNHDAGDVLENGYGTADDITQFYFALLRAAEIDAALVHISTRDDNIFDPRLMNARKLNTCVVYAKLDGREVYLDPGVPFMPFSYLPWAETAVKGLRLGPNAGEWVNTSLPRAPESRVERKATLKLEPNGTLAGKLVVTYTGLEASRRRVMERNEDATARRKFLEQDVEGDVPTGIEVKLTNTPDWTGSEAPLVAEYELRVPGWAAAAGNRQLMPMGLFSAGEKHMFEHGARVHPLYFMFPNQHSDEVVIELPSGWQASSLPKPRNAGIQVTTYSASAQATGNTLTLKRDLALNTIFVPQKYYPEVRDFFQTVRAGDEDQIVVAPGAAPKTASK